MHRVVVRVNPVPKLQVPMWPNRGENASHQMTFEWWYDKEFRARWKMDEAVKDKALSLCSAAEE